MRILPTKSSQFGPLNQLAGAPVCDRLSTLANPKASYKPALRFMGKKITTQGEVAKPIEVAVLARAKQRREPFAPDSMGSPSDVGKGMGAAQFYPCQRVSGSSEASPAARNGSTLPFGRFVLCKLPRELAR